jgi:GxxExxY protein
MINRGGRRDVNNLNELTDAIIGAAIDVHRTLGPGLLESTYEMCLCREPAIRGIPFERQVPIAVEYKGAKLDCGYRADIVVDGMILVEIKAVDSMLPIHDAQLLSYLKLGGWKIGLLINFDVELLRNGLRRRVLGLVEEVTL